MTEPSCGGVPGASHREETPGKTQDTLEGQIMSPDWPGNASVSPWRSRRKCLGRGKSERLCLDCCPRNLDKRKIYVCIMHVRMHVWMYVCMDVCMDGRMDALIGINLYSVLFVYLFIQFLECSC